MTIYIGGQGRRPFEAAIRDQAASGKVPAWTAEDEANLRRRVERIAARKASR